MEQKLYQGGQSTYLLDGDNVRLGLNNDLGFADEDRVENIRRVGEVGKLMVDAGLITLACFISPFNADREMVRHLYENGEFIEVYLDTPLAICEERDPKGLYKKAREGKIPNFTGISLIYEAPTNAEIRINTSVVSARQAVEQIYSYLVENKFIRVTE